MKLVGKGEDNVEVADGQEPRFSFVEPFGLLEALALRAMTIAAGIVRDTDVPTTLAGILVASEGFGATVFDVPEGNVLAGRESVAPSKLGTVLAEYVCDLASRS